MAISTFSKKLIFAVFSISCFLLIQTQAIASPTQQNKAKEFVPPPIPLLNTPELKNYVKTFHTFPSPYGYEPYRDKEGKVIKYSLKELNASDPYIPVTFYCNARTACPYVVRVENNNIIFIYEDKEVVSLTLGLNNSYYQPHALIGFYFPNDPNFYMAPPMIHQIDHVRIGDPILTVLFSQKILQMFDENQDGHRKGFFEAKKKSMSLDGAVAIDLPLASGNEDLSVGTVLSVIGLGQATGVEFTETVSQTTGETNTKQVQTGFSLSVGMESETKVGGGVVPVSETLKMSINTTLSTLVGNELSIEKENTISRSYAIKPGINDTYYWAIYQLGYSYRINAPYLEKVLKRTEDIWEGMISTKIGDNGFTKDKKPIGIILPPQAAYVANDIAVAIAVPVSGKDVFSQVLSAKGK